MSVGRGDTTFWSAPQVALDGRGRAAAVWVASSGRALVGEEADWTRGRGWTSPRTLWTSTPPAMVTQQLAVDPRGDAIVAWAENGGGPLARVRAAYRPAGGAWQPPRTISPPLVPAVFPVVAIDGRGRALVAWTGWSRNDQGDSPIGVEAVVRRQDGRWSKPRVLCACPTAQYLGLAMNTSGHALVAWIPETGFVTVAARSSSGRRSPPQMIPSLRGYLVQAAINDHGTAVVLAVGIDSLSASLRRGYGRFAPAQSIRGDAYWGSAMALAATGEAVVMWADYCCIETAVRPPGASSFNLQPGRQSLNVARPALAMDARGDTLALWTHSSNGVLYLDAARRPAGGTFDAGTQIGQIGDDCYKEVCCPGDPSVATTAQGAAVAVWIARPDPAATTCSAVEAATFTP